jgi:hypothetical protein
MSILRNGNAKLIYMKFKICGERKRAREINQTNRPVDLTILKERERDA